MLREAVGVLNVSLHNMLLLEWCVDGVGNAVEDEVMSVVVPASISGFGAVIENMQERLLLLAEGASRVISLLPKVQVHIVRKNIYCCIKCKFHHFLRQCLHCSDPDGRGTGASTPIQCLSRLCRWSRQASLASLSSLALALLMINFLLQLPGSSTNTSQLGGTSFGPDSVHVSDQVLSLSI